MKWSPALIVKVVSGLPLSENARPGIIARDKITVDDFRRTPNPCLLPREMVQSAIEQGQAVAKQLEASQ